VRTRFIVTTKNLLEMHFQKQKPSKEKRMLGISLVLPKERGWGGEMR